MTGDGVVGPRDRSRSALIESAADQRSDEPASGARATRPLVGDRRRHADARQAALHLAGREACASAIASSPAKAARFTPASLIGTSARLEPMNAGALDQSAIVDPAVEFRRAHAGARCSEVSTARSRSSTARHFWRSVGCVALALFVQTTFAPLLVVRGGVPVVRHDRGRALCRCASARAAARARASSPACSTDAVGRNRRRVDDRVRRCLRSACGAVARGFFADGLVPAEPVRRSSRSSCAARSSGRSMRVRRLSARARHDAPARGARVRRADRGCYTFVYLLVRGRASVVDRTTRIERYA